DWSAREMLTFALPANDTKTKQASGAGASGGFSLDAWKRAIRSVDHRQFAEAWYEVARHNATAARPLGSSHALAAVDPNCVPPVSLLKDGRELNGPHQMVEHVVWHPKATCRHACFLALGSF